MSTLDEYSYIWGADRDKYVLLSDEVGVSIFFIKNKEIMFYLLEEDALADSIISKMLESGNKIYNSIVELQEAVRGR